MKHTTKQPRIQLFCHGLVLISLLILALLGQPGENQGGWFACPPRLAFVSSSPLRVKKQKQGLNLRAREYHFWCYLADSYLPLFLRSWLLIVLWTLSGQQAPAWLIGWPWLLWLWQGMTAVWPELGQYRVWRKGGWLLWRGQQLVVLGFLSLGFSLWLQQEADTFSQLALWETPSRRWPLAELSLGGPVGLGCSFCGRQEPWVEVVAETDGNYTATLCGHFTLRIAGDDVFQKRQAILFLRQLEGPGPQRGGRRTRDGRTPFVSQEKVSAWFHLPQPNIRRLEKYWGDKDWANLHSLKAGEVLSWDLVARIVAVFVTFPWWGVTKVYEHLQQQGIDVTEKQVRQAAEQSGWSQLRQSLLKRYRLTADSCRPRDNWLVTDLLAQVQMLLGKLEAGEAMTREEEVSIAELQTLAAEVGIVAPPPLKALPWLMSVERVVFGQWQEVSDEAVHCIYCGSTHVVRKSRKPRQKRYYDAQGEVQTVDVYRYYCRNAECDKGTFTFLPPGLVPYSPYRTHVHLLAIQMYGWGHSTYRRTAEALGVSSMTVYRWVSAWGHELLPVAALFGVVRSSGVVGIDEKYVLVPKNDKPAGKMRRWMYVYLAVDVYTYDLLHIALYPHNDQDSSYAFLLALRAKGYHPHVIVTDLRHDYGPVFARVFSKAQHHECIFHALQNAQDHIKKAYGADYADKYPMAELLKRAIYDIFATHCQPTAQKRYEALMICRDLFIQDTPAAEQIFEFLERHWPTLVNGIGSDLIPTTNNTVELVIRRFDQHYQNFCGFDSIDTARLFLPVFEKLYRFTPFSQDAQSRIRGKCPLQLAGYNISQVPMASLCAGLSLDWPLEVATAHVPNS